MAKAIGKTVCSLWWLVGVIMALVFGRTSAGEVTAKYGVRPRRIVVPPLATESQRKQAEKNRPQAEALVAEYLDPAAHQLPRYVSPQLRARLVAETKDLIVKLGSMEYKVRQAASKRLVEIGPIALPALREASGHRDLEVMQRSEPAIGEIETRSRTATIAALRKIPLSAGIVLQEKIAEFTKTCDRARADHTRASRNNDKTGVARAKAAMQAARIRLQQLQVVYFQIAVGAEPICQPLYGVIP